MFIQIAPRVRVYLTEAQRDFMLSHTQKPFYSGHLTQEEADMAKILADKSIFVRKKLDNGTQYALNKRIKILPNAIKK